jgi:hypothetical protein
MSDRSLTLSLATRSPAAEWPARSGTWISMAAGAALVSLLAATLPSAAWAQDPPAKAAPGKAAPAKSAAGPAASGDTGKTSAAAKKTKPSAKKKVAEPQEEPEPQVADADDQQLQAAKEVLLGESGCEFNQKIQVDANAQHPGYLDMSYNKKKYMMKPVMSSTGAVRLEDVRSETLMIQISSKTMVMNQKTGQRLVDNCVHPDQKITTTDAEQVLMK